MGSNQLLTKTSAFFLSPQAKERSERLILTIAIVSYLVHLLIILLVMQGYLHLDSKLFKNPIAAIYTPFSFILVYEVYLLIFYLPQSISTYIGKQYEIITLIVVRRIFKDIANLELNTAWFNNLNDLQFTYDVATALILFVLIYYFYKHTNKQPMPTVGASEKIERRIEKYIRLKKMASVALIPVLVILAIYTFFNWTVESLQDYQRGILAFQNVNTIFFDDFFTILIIVEVLLLLFSFYYSDDFHKIIRNSGFVISTILIKMSFSVEGVVNNALILGAVLFGFMILLIHNMFEKTKVSPINP